MKIILFFWLLIPGFVLADDFIIIQTSGKRLIARHSQQSIELGQKFYVMKDSLVTGQAYIINITDQYCLLELSEGQAYAGDKLVELTKLEQAKYNLDKQRLNEQNKIAKQQSKIFIWTLATIVIALITYSQIK